MCLGPAPLCTWHLALFLLLFPLLPTNIHSFIVPFFSLVLSSLKSREFPFSDFYNFPLSTLHLPAILRSGVNPLSLFQGTYDGTFAPQRSLVSSSGTFCGFLSRHSCATLKKIRSTVYSWCPTHATGAQLGIDWAHIIQQKPPCPDRIRDTPVSIDDGKPISNNSQFNRQFDSPSWDEPGPSDRKH